MYNYLLECSDHLLIQKEIESLIKKEEFDSSFKTIYDIEEISLEQALEDLDTYSFLSDKKVIVINNILSKNAKESELNHLLKYIDNYYSDNLLIITLDKSSSNSFIKKLKSNKNVSYKKLDVDSISFIKNKLKDYKISNIDISFIDELCKKDITRIDSECEKLMIYKIDTKEINREDIEKLVIKKLGDSNEILFSLINNIMQKNKKQAFLKYKELKEYNIDCNSILGLMASQMRLISQIKVLKEKNYKNVEIQEELKVKSIYQINKLSEYIYNYSYNDIKKFISLVADTDYKIKSGRIDLDNAIELLIINL